MKPEIRDAILDGIEAACKRAGANTYDDAADAALRFFERMAELVKTVRTREHFVAMLDNLPDVLPDVEPFAFAFAEYAPYLMRATVGEIFQQFAKDFPVGGGGRPSLLPHDKAVSMIKEMGRLVTDGYSILVATKTVARRYRVSSRTVERAWQNRARLLDGERKVTLDETKEWFRSLLLSPGPILPPTPPTLLQEAHEPETDVSGANEKVQKPAFPQSR